RRGGRFSRSGFLLRRLFRLCGRRCRFGLGGGLLRRSGRGTGADVGEGLADLDGFVFPDDDLYQGAGDGGWHLGVHLVRGDLEERFVHLDLFADLLQPPGHGAFGDRLAERRHGDRLAIAVCRWGRFRRGRFVLRSGRGRGLLLGSLLRGCLLGGGGFFRWLLRLGGGAFGFLGAGARAVTDPGKVGADLDGVVLRDEDLLKHAGDGGRDLRVDLVGRYLE